MTPPLCSFRGFPRRHLFPLLLTCALAVVRADDDRADAPDTPAPPPPDPIQVMFFNLYNYEVEAEDRLKPEKAMEACATLVTEICPDVLVVCEMGSDKAFRDFRKRLSDKGCEYPYSSLVEAYDRYRRLAVFAKTAPVQVKHDVTSSYNIKDTRVLVRRGFAHCVFTLGDEYTLHVVGAHLKSKAFHRLGQTDMRRYEARRLRYLVDDILKQDPEANVVVVGDMNDTRASSPINAIVNRRLGTERELFDLRPADPSGVLWTHFWDDEDTYSRFDYAFVTYHTLPEIDFAKTRIVAHKDWQRASDHRPVLVTLVPRNRQFERSLLELFHRNHRMNVD